MPQKDSEDKADAPQKGQPGEKASEPVSDGLTVSGIINSVRKSRGATLDQPGHTKARAAARGAEGGTEATGEYHIPYCLFNTHGLVNRLLDAGLAQEQAVLVMTLVKYKVYEGMERIKANMLTKSDLESDAYLFRAALQELRTETQMIRKNDQAILESQAAAINREIESLMQRLNDEVSNLRADIEIEVSNHKHDSNQEMKSLDMELHALANKYQVVLGEMKTEIETVKLESIRRGLLAAVVTTLVLLAILWGPELLENLKGTDNKGASDTEEDGGGLAEVSAPADANGGHVDSERVAVQDGVAGNGRTVVGGPPPSEYGRGRLLSPPGYTGNGQRYRDHSHLNIQYDPTISAAEGYFGSHQAPRTADAEDNYDDWFDAFFYPPQDIERRRSGTSATLIDTDPTFDSAYWRSTDQQDHANEAQGRGEPPTAADPREARERGEPITHIPLHFTYPEQREGTERRDRNE
ncbi:hypothetical protein GGF46_001703 [Coemansia sp. RSA 552]|nr:hypothetical protein GGF46_001703 [Coemansia sp. RSA 552]